MSYTSAARCLPLDLLKHKAISFTWTLHRRLLHVCKNAASAIALSTWAAK